MYRLRGVRLIVDDLRDSTRFAELGAMDSFQKAGCLLVNAGLTLEVAERARMKARNDTGGDRTAQAPAGDTDPDLLVVRGG